MGLNASLPLENFFQMGLMAGSTGAQLAPTLQANKTAAIQALPQFMNAETAQNELAIRAPYYQSQADLAGKQGEYYDAMANSKGLPMANILAYMADIEKNKPMNTRQRAQLFAQLAGFAQNQGQGSDEENQLMAKLMAILPAIGGGMQALGGGTPISTLGTALGNL